MGRSTSWEEQRPVALSHEMHPATLPFFLFFFVSLLIFCRKQGVCYRGHLLIRGWAQGGHANGYKTGG